MRIVVGGFASNARPTVAQVANVFDVTPERIREAAREANVPIRENRINATHLDAICGVVAPWDD